MNYLQIIWTVNSSCIIILIILALILLSATRFRGENSYVASIIVLPTIPVYLYNISRMSGWYEIALFLFPLAFSINTLLMPLLWLFTRRNFDNNFRFGYRHLFHFIPMILCLIIAFSMSRDEQLQNILYEMSGNDLWIGDLNSGIILLQILIYFPLIFYFILWKRRQVGNFSSDADWGQKAWILHFMILFASLFVVSMICYAIEPRTDTWLIQILNVIAMIYLVHNAISHPISHKLTLPPPLIF